MHIPTSPRSDSVWAQLHVSLSRKVHTLAAEKWWQRAQSRFPSMARYTTAAELIFSETLVKRGTPESMDVRDEMLSCLVAIYQDLPALPRACPGDAPSDSVGATPIRQALPASGGHWCAADRELALAVLWLCLWPGLDGIRGRRVRRFDSPDALTSAVAANFLQSVTTINLARTTRVAAYLVRSTEREVIQDLQCEARASAMRQRKRRESEDDYVDCLECVDPQTARGSLLPHSSLDLGHHVSRLVEELEPMVGDDAPLIVASLALGEDQDAAANVLGIPVHAARKRVQRGRALLRESFFAA